jgi:hypothetical protein
LLIAAAMRIYLLPLVAALGCGAGYEPGSLWRHGTAEVPHATVGCLDLALRIGYQRCPAGTDESNCPRQPVAEVMFGNRCDREVEVDLAAIRFETRPDRQALTIYDPESVVEPGVLDGRASAHERFELRGASGRQTQVCANLGGVTPGPENPEVCTPIAAVLDEVAQR